MPKSASNDPKRNEKGLTEKIKDFFKPIEPLGGTAGRQNKNVKSQIDEFGDPKDPKKGAR
jgi:hypothetical protein